MRRIRSFHSLIASVHKLLAERRQPLLAEEPDAVIALLGATEGCSPLAAGPVRDALAAPPSRFLQNCERRMGGGWHGPRGLQAALGSGLFSCVTPFLRHWSRDTDVGARARSA